MFFSKIIINNMPYSMHLFKSVNIHRTRLGKLRILFRNNSQTTNINKQEGIENLFLNPEVQKILKKITGLDYEKIFAISQSPLEPHKYEFVTEQKLKELQEKSAVKAAKKLQMPPVMSVRKPINEILGRDPELQGYLTHKVIFTDISPNTTPRNRVMTVREVDGTLRKATWEERDRMNQVWYPIPGRHIDTPKLFESPYFERLLEEGSYKFILDSACLQFEPDHPEYHRVTEATYEDIKSKKQFDVLRSTRYFGTMAFHYAYIKDIDPLLIDMIERKLLSDAADTIYLLHLIHKTFPISPDISRDNHLAIIEDYIMNHASSNEELKFALQTYVEQNSNTNKELSM